MFDDFPAAHSMDTTWFAVDRDGRVGVFFSCENGSVPAAAGIQGDVSQAIHFLRANADGGPLPEDEGWGLLNDEDFLARQGLFVFWCSGGSVLVDPYFKTRELERPLHVDQLPSGFRDQCRRVQFPVSFAEVTIVQPCEHVECSFWDDPAGYRSADGKTVRPFPGREWECRQTLEGYRKGGSSWAADWHLEGEPPAGEGE
jgi:hypothetical protein